MHDIPKSQEETGALLRAQGWKLIHQDSFMLPASSYELWTREGYPYQLRLAWPLNGDCNGATTTEIEVDRALHFINDSNCDEEPLFVETRCRVCGCTDDRACPGGCYWVEEDLCSQCAETTVERGN